MKQQNLTIRDKNEWSAYIKRSLTYEVFHTWRYHLLNKEGEAMLFVHQEDDIFIGLPVIKRKIEDSGFYDMTSVYGYSGPISNIDLAHLPTHVIEGFKSAFNHFMTEENTICIFSRLHPFLNQHNLLQGIGGIKENGTTLYLDLSLPLDLQRKQYDKRLGRQIRKLRERGYVIKEQNSPEAIRNFVKIYYKNMDRVNASSAYYFDEQYFTDLLNPEEFDNKLILVYNGDELICGAVILVSDNIIRNHLSATAPEYLKESPSKLLTDEISIIGRRLGKKIFHLGGGVGGKQDSLFMFKKMFSNQEVKDHIWCYINNELAYNDLVSKANVQTDVESGYFPLYRRPKRNTQPYISNIETSNA